MKFSTHEFNYGHSAGFAFMFDGFSASGIFTYEDDAVAVAGLLRKVADVIDKKESEIVVTRKAKVMHSYMIRDDGVWGVPDRINCGTNECPGI